MASTRFTAAVHILAELASVDRSGLTSDQLALAIRDDPGVARRLMGRLRRGGLVSMRSGPGGGVRLIVPPAQIDLARVYRAVMLAGPAVRFHRPSPARLVGRHLEEILVPVIGRAEAGYFAPFEALTIDDVAREVRAAAHRHRRPFRGRLGGLNAVD